MIIDYESNHLGCKIRPPLELNLLNQFRDSLVKNNFEILQSQLDFNPPPIVNFARKNDVMVQIHFPANSINVIGNSPNDMLDVLDDIISLLKEDLGLNLDIAISFYELLTVLTVKTDANPLEVLENKFGLGIEEFEELDASTTGIKISTSKLVDETELFEFHIEPKVLSPESTYFLRIMRRTKELNKIKDLNNNMKSIIEKSIDKIEERK
jgi:hypothetical protein